MSVEAAVTESQVLSAIKGLEDRFEKRIEELSKPAGSGAERSAGPWARRGEDPFTSRGFSFMKLFGVMARRFNRDNAKVECELVDKLRKNYESLGGQRELTDSVLLPFSSQMICSGWQDEALAREVGECVRAGISGYDREEVMRLREQYWGRTKALSWVDSTTGAELVGPPLFGELIDLLRNNEIFLKAGARSLPMPPTGRITYPRQTGAATAYWVGESTTITESQPATGDVVLQAKKLGVLVKIPNELFRFASVSVEQFVREDMARVMALKLDKSLLDAVGSTVEPKGLLNYAGITSHTASTTGANGDTFTPEDVGKMIGKVESQNAIFRSFVMRPLMYTALSNRRADAVSAADGKGPFLFNVWREMQEQFVDPSRMNVGMLNGYPVFKSTQVSNTRTKGSGTDLTYILGGDFSDFLVAMSGTLEFQLSREGDTPFTQDQTWFRGILYCDGAPRHEASFIKTDQLLEA